MHGQNAAKQAPQTTTIIDEGNDAEDGRQKTGHHTSKDRWFDFAWFHGLLIGPSELLALGDKTDERAALASRPPWPEQDKMR
jgi:hypothetical protein